MVTLVNKQSKFHPSHPILPVNHRNWYFHFKRVMMNEWKVTILSSSWPNLSQLYFDWFYFHYNLFSFTDVIKALTLLYLELCRAKDLLFWGQIFGTEISSFVGLSCLGLKCLYKFAFFGTDLSSHHRQDGYEASNDRIPWTSRVYIYQTGQLFARPKIKTKNSKNASTIDKKTRKVHYIECLKKQVWSHYLLKMEMLWEKI